MIDSKQQLTAFIDSLPHCKGPNPSLYVDLEGNNLSREGTLSLVTVLVEPRRTIHLIDITGLGNDAFATAGSDGRTIKQLLESAEVCKVFFDIRNDSEALYSLHGIRVQGIEDLQLMELASRISWRKHVNGLAKCIERDAPISFGEKQRWKSTKKEGCRLFDPALGGSYAVFDQRPLSAAMRSYCVQDVVHMPALRNLYLERLCDVWLEKIEIETRDRIRHSQGQGYVGWGQRKALGPQSWLNWEPSAKQKRSRVLISLRQGSATPSDKSEEQMTNKQAEDVAGILGQLSGMRVPG
jgi:exonuclease 3'-5' domain-containing protein 1